MSGKSFAYIDPSSTSGYILPKALFDSLGITLSSTVFAMQHPNVVTMVYQRRVDAGACYYAPPDPKTGAIQVPARALRPLITRAHTVVDRSPWPIVPQVIPSSSSGKTPNTTMR
ncbi:MAG: PhnD/SsuA/transferrin family substrate-binding protein [Bacteroidetes bacterium]|nr:PhnD/SsuA/transferrin family substrate-binding protein [Bacteroidota bacterium]